MNTNNEVWYNLYDFNTSRLLPSVRDKNFVDLHFQDLVALSLNDMVNEYNTEHTIPLVPKDVFVLINIDLNIIFLYTEHEPLVALDRRLDDYEEYIRDFDFEESYKRCGYSYSTFREFQYLKKLYAESQS